MPGEGTDVAQVDRGTAEACPSRLQGCKTGMRIQNLLVESRVVVELKSIESFAAIHEAIILTYLRLCGRRLGLLINFNVNVLSDGIKRYII
jgi:GxxExxY protein